MEGSFDWDTNAATVYTNDEIKVTAVTDLVSAPAFTVADPTIVSATPNSTGTSWTIRGKAVGTTTITIDTTNIQSSISTLTVTAEDGHYLNQRGLARVWSKVKNYVSTQVSGYDASWLAAAPPVVATAEQADALCQAISDGVPIYLRYEDTPQGDPYITYATDASTTGGEPVVTFLTGALNGTKTARTYTISRGGMGVQGSVYSSTTTLVDTQTGKVTASNIDFATFEYSTTEQTVGMFNNRTLYRRSYAVATGPQSGADVQISIASDIAMVVKVEGYLSNGDIMFPLPSPRITLANTIAVYVDILNKRIVLEAGSDRSGFSGYVTLYYIKS